jgi:hypothetical protein
MMLQETAEHTPESLTATDDLPQQTHHRRGTLQQLQQCG